MALPTITTANFTGFVNISQDAGLIDDFNDFISRGREDHIRYLLGGAAYIEIRDSNQAAFTALFAGTDWVDDDGDSRVCDSLQDVLLMLIYNDWQIENGSISTAVGVVMNFNENAEGPSNMQAGAMGVRRLARASQKWDDSICPFIEHFRKVTEEITSVDNTDPNNPVLTVSAASSFYLEDGDTVSILNVAYTAANVTATTFSVNAPGLGPSFLNEEATWEPFGNVQSTLPGIEVGMI